MTIDQNELSQFLIGTVLPKIIKEVMPKCLTIISVSIPHRYGITEEKIMMNLLREKSLNSS